MNIKVFISHQMNDSKIAEEIAHRLKIIHDIDSYLDVIDPSIRHGDDLAEHIRYEMGKCNQLLAVVSYNTRNSWWVPWEIGVASEKEFPLATFLNNVDITPEYLEKWPHLHSISDIDSYAYVSKLSRNNYVSNRAALGERASRSKSTQNFFTDLRRELGQ